MKEEYFETREIFLRQFVYNLIKNYQKFYNIKQTEQIKQLVKSPPVYNSPPQIQMRKRVAIRPIQQNVNQAPIPSSFNPNRQLINRQPIKKSQLPMELPSVLNSIAPSSQVSNPTIIASMNKMNPLLVDFSITSIECPGPEKPVIVSKGGLTQTTGIVLSNEEINRFMDEISSKTKIPVIPGVFKAAFDNFILTAVVSEFVGTRFFIQRKQNLR
jgi:hypothetical protein